MPKKVFPKDKNKKDEIIQENQKPVKLYADNYVNKMLNRVGLPLGSNKLYTCKICKKKGYKHTKKSKS